MIKIIIGGSKPATITPERASWNVKVWFCFWGVINTAFGVLMLFGPWWAKLFSPLSMLTAILCLHSAYKEHKNPFYKD